MCIFTQFEFAGSTMPANGSQVAGSPAKNRRKNPDYCGKTFLRNVLYVFNFIFFV